MDFGQAKFILSRCLNHQLLVFASERQVGKIYKFQKKTENTFVCSSCIKLGKSRRITVKDGRIIGIKHPEEDHHVDCQPADEESVQILNVDR